MWNLIKLPDNTENSLKSNEDPGFVKIQKLQEALVSQALEFFNKFLLVSKPKLVDVLTYEDVISFFVEHRAKNPKFEKGAILRQFNNDNQCTTVYLIFLDQENQIVQNLSNSNGKKPFGEKIIVQALDDELVEAFGKENLLILE